MEKEQNCKCKIKCLSDLLQQNPEFSQEFSSTQPEIEPGNISSGNVGTRNIRHINHKLDGLPWQLAEINSKHFENRRTPADRRPLLPAIQTLENVYYNKM